MFQEAMNMLRYTKNKYKRESVFAKLIDKKVSEYFAVPGKIPTPEALYELVFMTEKGEKNFEVSVFVYNVVDIGMEGPLVFQGYQLISFGDWIKEYSE
ncbi:hypothetical protein HMPREF9430_01614 [Solobacterium moorei F0204]|uniref:DUF2500 family protein n=2 Tax=Solobacterium moorei TaxID=102148 RepID=E7MQ89_9FIRM|nr:hypothetical protein HMPREF9430_01614 [Solobacterium moorei F0204]